MALRITNHEVGVRFRMPTATDEQAEKTEETYRSPHLQNGQPKVEAAS